MLTGLKACVALFGIAGLLSPARAQAPAPLSAHVVRSISPADTDFRDLDFLTQEIGSARVVMLGEPSHGEGNVFEAKIRLLRFLQQKMGFTTLAFESGFYELHKAQQELEAGKSAQEALENSVFPIWTRMQEFQAVLPLVGKGKLRVAGFDPQLSGEYSGDLVDELRAFLAPEKGSGALNYNYLEGVVSFMGEHYAFSPTAELGDFEKELDKAVRLVDKAAASSVANRRTEAAFWQQCLRSLLAQGRNYALNNPGGKTETEFKAKDSNPRDAQMADNLLWYLKQHPQEKVVCWGALPHFSNKAEVLDNVEIQQYRPMGRSVKAALGADQVYILGTLSGGGTHQFSTLPLKAVPTPAAGTLEAELLAQPAEYAFVSLKHDAAGRRLTTYAIEYTPITGPWSEVVDGFLFLRAVNPPHFSAPMDGVAPAAAGAEPVAGGATSLLSPAPRRAGGTVRNTDATGRLVQGIVFDQKTKARVPYASVAVPALGVGTIADGQGNFVLKVPMGASLQVSSVGYATATVAANSSPLTVRLVPTATELQEVQVQGESLDPRKIMGKVLAALPTNYEPNAYTAAVYTRRRVSNFDTLNYEAEYVSQVFEPAGYHHFGGAAGVPGPQQLHRVRELHEFKANWRTMLFSRAFDKGQGFNSDDDDPVLTSPLFNPRTLSKFRLRLDSVVERGGEVLYVIGFAAKKSNHLTTGNFVIADYSGRVCVQQRDHAVLRYEALWQIDTLLHNAIIHKYLPKADQLALRASIYAGYRTGHAVAYARAANGRYHLERSVAQGLRAGRFTGGPSFYRQVSCEQYFTPLPVGTTLPPLSPKISPTIDPRSAEHELFQLQYTDYHPNFWATYQRPKARK